MPHQTLCQPPPWELHKLATEKAVILVQLGKCFLIAFANNASLDKLINQISVKNLKCSEREQRRPISDPPKTKATAWDEDPPIKAVGPFFVSVFD